MLFVHTPDAPMARVLKAVSQGGRTSREIARMADVDPRYIRVYLRRLKARELILHKDREWHLKNIGCLLSEIWQ